VFGRFGKVGRVKRALSALADELPLREVLAGLSAVERDEVVTARVEQLLFDDDLAAAAALLEVALALPDVGVATLLAAENVCTLRGDLAQAIELCERALEVTPDDDALAIRLAGRLTDADRAQEALDVLDLLSSDGPELRIERGRALLALDRLAEAVEALRPAGAAYESAMKHAMTREAWDEARRGYEDVSQLISAAQSQQSGAESVVVEPALAGKLDARSAVNYRLLAESLMVDTPYRPGSVELATPLQTLERARARRQHGDEDAVSLALQGEAELRLGKVEAALRSFEAATAADGKHFAGFRGIAAAMTFDQHRLLRRAAELPSLPGPRDLSWVVPDWGALTELERAVVLASIHPLRGALSALKRADATIRLLPIDVRTVDLPQWQSAARDRLEGDHRALAATGGVASAEERLAAARIEELLDVASESGWTFGHEFAHLVYFHLEDRAPVLDLYERAARYPHVAGSYQMSNEHEFFAVAYQDYLRERYAMPSYRERDGEGVWAACVAYFDRLAADERW
jgi:tetratricopeptide (TPR) repeat protein